MLVLHCTRLSPGRFLQARLLDNPTDRLGDIEVQSSNRQHKAVMMWPVRAPYTWWNDMVPTYLPLPTAASGLIPRVYILNLRMPLLILSLNGEKRPSATISRLDETGHCQHTSVAPRADAMHQIQRGTSYGASLPQVRRTAARDLTARQLIGSGGGLELTGVCGPSGRIRC